MRYFLLGFLLLGLVVVSVAGFRGGITRRPPLELFPDMDRQAKLRPQSAHGFFPDGLGSRLHPDQTIPRSQPVLVAGTPVHPFEDHPFNTGYEPGTTNFVQHSPVPVSETLLARGRERFAIHCQPCHGAAGDGKGPTTKYGMVVIGNLHDPRIVQQPDGEIFHVISEGRNLMQGYAANLTAADRWAILAYVRALQLSHLATLEEVPEGLRATLK